MSENLKILVGKIVAPQGLKGEVRVQTYTEKPADLKDLQIDDLKFSFVRENGHDVAIIRVDNVNDRNGAEALRGTKLYVSRDSLPQLSDDEFYHADLIGMKVSQNNEIIGTVVQIHNFGAGDIIEIQNGDMFAFKFANVDAETNTIFMD